MNNSWNPYLLLFLGWALPEIGKWALLKREQKKRVWEKFPTHTLIPRAWDWLFSKDKCYWLQVKLKDGSIISGYYGTNSFTSGYGQNEDIYLEDAWLTGEYENRTEKGIYIPGREISFISFYENKYNENEV